MYFTYSLLEVRDQRKFKASISSNAEEHFPPLMEVERILKPIVVVLRKLEDPACSIASVLPHILDLVQNL